MKTYSVQLSIATCGVTPPARVGSPSSGVSPPARAFPPSKGAACTHLLHNEGHITNETAQHRMIYSPCLVVLRDFSDSIWYLLPCVCAKGKKHGDTLKTFLCLNLAFQSCLSAFPPSFASLPTLPLSFASLLAMLSSFASQFCFPGYKQNDDVDDENVEKALVFISKIMTLIMKTLKKHWIE